MISTGRACDLPTTNEEVEKEKLMVVGSHCHDVIFRDGRVIAQGVGGAAAFISNLLSALFALNSDHHRHHYYVSKVGNDFAYHTLLSGNINLLVSSSAPTTLFHAHFNSQTTRSDQSDRRLHRVRSCNPILPDDLPAHNYRFGLAVGVAGEIPPSTLSCMLDRCQLVFVDAQSLIRTFDPTHAGAVRLVPIEQTPYSSLLPRIAFLKASADESPFVDIPRARRCCQCVVVTQGQHGCTLFSKNREFHVPPFPTVQVDPTGAGDSFLGGFVVGLLSGLTLGESALLGNFFGSITVSQIGVPKFDSSMLHHVKKELERRSAGRASLCERKDVDFDELVMPEDLYAFLKKAARLCQADEQSSEMQHESEASPEYGLIPPIPNQDAISCSSLQ